MKAVAMFVVRHPWLALLCAVALVVVTAAGVVAAGLVPIRASSGHWAATEWLLQFAMRRGVISQSLLAPQPPDDLDDERRVLLGAGHFETGCRSCHASPGERLPPIPLAMTPQPPPLGPAVGAWDARELFYIVKHGVKFTGMPAWPAQQRDDEVWAVVAFLRRLPSMTAEDYAHLVWGTANGTSRLIGPDGVPPSVVVRECARCHGLDGMGRGRGAFPKLAGQRLEYMMRAMHAFADARRSSGVMQAVAANVPERERHLALEYYASLSIKPEMPDRFIEEGRALVSRGDPSQGIPICADCHVADDANPAYPRLQGQFAEYLVQQLQLLQQRRRGGSEFVHLMHAFVDRLSPQQIEAAASYLSSLPSRPSGHD